MLLFEQKYSNRNRLYYHGFLNKSNNNDFFLTTKPLYALVYSKGLEGTIEIYRLKQTANIFNMRCKSDEDALRNYCKNNNLKNYLSYFETLKNNDWLNLTEPGRQEIIKALKELNYDGFFNFEIDKNALEKLKYYPIFPYTDLHVSSPAVAIFNKNVLEQISSYSGEELKKQDFVKESAKKEKEYISSIANDSNNNFEKLRPKIFCLSDKELSEEIEKAKLNKFQQKVKAKEILENWKLREKGRN